MSHHDDHLLAAIFGLRDVADRHAREVRLLRLLCVGVGFGLLAMALMRRWRA